MVLVSLPGNAGYPTAGVDINTNVKFVTAVGSSVPNTCAAIIASAKTIGNKANFLSQYKISEITQNLSNLLTGLTPPTTNQKTPLTSIQAYTELDVYLTTLENSQLPVQRLVATCLQEATAPDPSALNDAEKRLDLSKTRYELISPDRQSIEPVSYYEGWFPIHRPVKERNIFILFGVSIVLLIASIAQFLRMNGVELLIQVPAIHMSPMNFSGIEGYLLSGTVVGGIIVWIGISRGWF